MSFTRFSIAPFVVSIVGVAALVSCSSQDVVAPTTNGKADGLGLSNFECALSDGASGFIEAFDFEFTGATLSQDGDGMALELRLLDLFDDSSLTFSFSADDQSFPTIIEVTKLAGAWESDDASPFFSVSLSLESVDGEVYDATNALGITLDITPAIQVTCVRGEDVELDSNQRLTAHVAADIDRVLEAGAAQLEMTVDELDVRKSSVTCVSPEGAPGLPGSNAGVGACTLLGFTRLYAVTASLEDGQTVYGMTILATED